MAVVLVDLGAEESAFIFSIFEFCERGEVVSPGVVLDGLGFGQCQVVVFGGGIVGGGLGVSGGCGVAC